MSDEQPQPRVTTQRPAEPMVYVAPAFLQVGMDKLLANSATFSDLLARVVALEAGGGSAGATGATGSAGATGATGAAGATGATGAAG